MTLSGFTELSDKHCNQILQYFSQTKKETVFALTVTLHLVPGINSEVTFCL